MRRYSIGFSVTAAIIAALFWRYHGRSLEFVYLENEAENAEK
jgi:hypothetical protein